MINQRIHKLSMYGLIALTFILLGAIHIWAPVCDGFLELSDGRFVPMRCLYTAKVAIIIALLLSIQAITTLVTKKSNPVMLIVLGIMLIAVTYESIVGIGVCKSVMACHNTALWLRIGGGVTILVGIASFFNKKE